MTATDRHALVFGATGFLGRHLILALDRAGVRVTAATRSGESFTRLAAWLDDHGCPHIPDDLRVDFHTTGLVTGDDSRWSDVTEVYNCAGAFEFGMTVEQARHANVDSVRRIVSFAAGLPHLSRLVYVSGYRVGGQNPETVPWSPRRTRLTYQKLGAYEASKVEADAVFHALADQLGVPWTVVNPSGVIGTSTTGESDQQPGLAASMREIWQGTLTAVPGNTRTFVPVIAVDYLAEFMTLLPQDPATVGAAYWVLDDATPALPDLLAQVADHYQVALPPMRVPIAVVKRLPRALTKADPETLTFLSTDRYPTSPARDLAHSHGLAMPNTTTTILRWADYLAAHRFGTAAADRGPRAFDTIAGVRTFRIGDASARTVIVPGLPVNADTWAPVAASVGGVQVLDLPGLGMSGGAVGDWNAWLDALIEQTSRTHLIGHSIGAAAVLRAAATHPDKIASLTLVAPFFLQPRAGFITRLSPLTRWYLQRARTGPLSRRLTGTVAHADALQSTVQDLRRAQTAATAASLLSASARERWRNQLNTTLTSYPGPVHVIIGADDPLTDEARTLLESHAPRIELTTITGAGHHPQLTHPDALAVALTRDRGTVH